MRKIFILAATLAICGVMAYFFINFETAPGKAEEEAHHHDDFISFSQEQCKTHGIDVCETSSGSLQQIVRAPAKIIIVADQLAHVLPKVSGIAQTAYKNLGDPVIKGELLATFESKEMAEAKSAYLTALKKEQLANDTFEREQSLFEKNLSTAQDYQTASHDNEEAAIDKELSRQKLYALGLSFSEIEQLPNESPNQLLTYELRSPITGQVIDRHLSIGEWVSNDHEAYVIANLNPVWAEIQIFPRDRRSVKKEQQVTVKSHDGHSAEGKVVYLSPVINENTHTSTAIVEIDNASGEWFPGAFAQAELVAETVPAANVVPKSAIQEIDGKPVLFVVRKDGFVVRPITTGRGDEQHQEVLDGLEKGETYAAKNTFLLKAEFQKEEAEHMD